MNTGGGRLTLFFPVKGPPYMARDTPALHFIIIHAFVFSVGTCRLIRCFTGYCIEIN